MAKIKFGLPTAGLDEPSVNSTNGFSCQRYFVITGPTGFFETMCAVEDEFGISWK